MANRALAYVSEPIKGLSTQKVAALVEDAAAFNQLHGITGLLLFDGTRFLQYLEGPEEALKRTYSRILASTSHHEIVELARGRISGRMFPAWSMRLLPVGAPELSQAALADWRGFVKRAGRQGGTPAAMDHLAAAAAPYLA